MADGVKAATLAPCEDEDVSQGIKDLTGKIHRSLDGAKILVFWALDRPIKWWGGIKLASEQVWWATGGIDGGVDILLTLNRELWTELGREARTGLLDHFLDQVRRKESGNSEMQTEAGIRALYERNESTLKLSDRVMARNPAFVQAIKELKRLWRALSDPAQFELELEAADEGDDHEDSDPGDEQAPPTAKRGRKPKAAAGPLAKEPVVFYYAERSLEDFGPMICRFSEADCQPFSLEGVHYLTDGEQIPADLSTLSYKTDGVAVRPVRAALEETHQGWASAALAKAQPAATA